MRKPSWARGYKKIAFLTDEIRRTPKPPRLPEGHFRSAKEEMSRKLRIYPEAKTALINWSEENFHEIDAYVFVCTMKDGVHQTIHHVDNRVQALGILEAAKDGEFKPRPS